MKSSVRAVFTGITFGSVACLIQAPAFAGGGGHAPVSSDGNGLEVSFMELSGSGGRSEPFAGAGRVTGEALSMEGVDIYGGGNSSPGNFRRLAALPVPGGEAGAEVILGPDTRERTYTTKYPARAKALITFTGGRCSGNFISKDTVATAGHCVHQGRGGTWRRNFKVYPGKDGRKSPYGSCTAKRAYTVTGWTNSSNEQYDYGAIKLRCTVGNKVGWFGMTTANPKNQPAIVQGYPGDKPLEQWFSADKVRATTSRQIFYPADTFGGMSGSGVWYDRNGPYITGIHAYGPHGSGVHRKYNHGTRIVKAVFNNLVNWKNAP